MSDNSRLDAQHRRLLGLLGLAIFFEGYGRSVVSVLLRPIGEDLAVPGPQLSYALAAISAGALGVLLLGHLTDRFGRRRLLLGCVLVYSLLGAATATATTLAALVAWQGAARMFQGGALAGLAVFFLGMSYDVAGFAFTAFWPMSRHGWSAARTSALIIVAGGIGLPGFWVGGRLTDRMGRRRSAALFLVGLALAEAAFF